MFVTVCQFHPNLKKDGAYLSGPYLWDSSPRVGSYSCPQILGYSGGVLRVTNTLAIRDQLWSTEFYSAGLRPDFSIFSLS
jgi:hypothetical protein